MKTKTVIILVCARCEYEWTPRTDNPKQCPRCKSHLWNKQKTKEE